MVDQLNGKTFKLDLASSKNFDNYLRARGSPPEIVKLSTTTDAVMTWDIKGDQFTVKVDLPAVNHQTIQTFKIGQEVEHTARDGLKTKSVWTRDGDKLIETQNAGGKTFVITHDYSNPGEANITFVAGSVTASHTYRVI